MNTDNAASHLFKMQFVNFIAKVFKMNSEVRLSTTRMQCNLAASTCLVELERCHTAMIHQSSHKETSTTSKFEADVTTSTLAMLFRWSSIRLLVAAGSSKILGVGSASFLKYFYLYRILGEAH